MAHAELPSFRPRRRDGALRSLTSTARQDHRFWMAEAIQRVSVPGIPNGGYRCRYR